VSTVVAKAQSGDVLPDRMVSAMILEAKFQRKATARHKGNGLPQPKQSKIEEEAREQVRQIRDKKTSEAAETLLKALGTEGVGLVVETFSEEEWPWDLISALRRRIGVDAAASKSRQ
jgi:beta-phosphoglucomutase-like phosphatase (HAD superfamily)